LRDREVFLFRGLAALFFAGRPVFVEPFLAVLRAGTFAPFLRASEIPMAIACLRLVTFLPDLPEVNVPFFFLRIALATVFCAFFEYFAITFFFESKKNRPHRIVAKSNSKDQG
jgi:hypothetical protein